MKSFKSFLIEGKLGDCFEVAGRAMLDLHVQHLHNPDDVNMEKEGLKLIHALVYGEGELEGRRFSHAFNQLGDYIFDNSNGNKIMMRKENYFKQGGIKPKEKGSYIEYNMKESMLKMGKHHHWGPWDLNQALEEEIPDEKKEIGNKKMKISSKELKMIKNKE